MLRASSEVIQRSKYLIGALFFLLIFAVYTLGSSPKVSLSSIEAPDIEASITALYGSSTRPIILFGQEAAVGEVIQANLDHGDGTSIPTFRDPLPVHTFCGQGCRNNDKSVISRIGVSSGAGRDVLLIIDLAGATGFQPGSAGYIRITNPEWHIVGIVAGRAAINADYAGYGFRIDRAAGVVEWYGRGGCPACACPENGVNCVLLLRKGEAGTIDLEGSGTGPIGTPQVDIEAAITALYGNDICPIVLFGQEANVGQVIQANLDYGDHTGIPPFRDPLPDHTLCVWSGGWRNSEKSVISRIGISAGYGQDVLLFVDLAGATGFQPGSAGYIQILDPSWRIVDVVAGSATMNTDYAGYGFRIDKTASRVEWYGRGGCPACACHENGPNFVLLLRKVPSNQPPVASFTFFPAEPAIGEEVTFDASSSYDPDGEIVSYEWDFGDGTTGQGEVVTHVYSQAGTYTLRLTVTDNLGAQESTSKAMVISGVPDTTPLPLSKTLAHPMVRTANRP